jgi:ribosomal protein S18 acetylase RimI-like enzyme
MNILERNIGVLMATEQLKQSPVFEMPSGFSMRWFSRGDEATWVAVQQAAERYQPIDEALFWKQFGNDEARLAARVGFLEDAGGNQIGTISAWNDAEYNGRDYGRIHWVAIVPELQGRGLGKAMMSAACRRLLELGHERAYLVTSTARVPAINLYRAFGFEPVVRDEDERISWQALMPHLKP